MSAFSARRWAGWLGVVLLVAVVPPACGFQFKDGDSDLYAVISGQLSTRPFSEWLSPAWPVPSYKTGLFQEHMAFFFWPPALVGMLGVPPVPAALLCNALYMVGILWVLHALGRRVLGESAARLSMAAWLLSYAGVQYLVRNNHETPLALFVLLGVLAVVRTVEGRAWWLLAALAGAGCVAMKGVVGVVVLPALASWAYFMGGGARRWGAVVAAVLGAVTLTGAHDVLFQQANGHSFLLAYLDIHTGYAAAREKASVFRKVSNIAYYAGVPLFWSLPASLVLAWYAWRRRAQVREPGAWPARAVLGMVLVYVLFFSLFDRRASRYVFSLYPVMALAAGPALLEALSRVRDGRWLRSLAWLPEALMLASVLVMGARVYVHNHHYSFYSPNNPRVAPTADAGTP